MRFAVLTAYSPTYRDVAAQCTPSHKSFAERWQGQFHALPLPQDGRYRKRKLWLIQEWLCKVDALLWLDSELIVPQQWELPRLVSNFAFPTSYDRAELFASLWRNTRESFDLLNHIADLQTSLPELEACTALNLALRHSTLKPGRLRPGLIHYQGEDLFKRERKLRCEARC